MQVLKDNHQDFEIIEYLKVPLSKSELKDLIKKSERSITEFIRKGEKVYKENYKGKDLTENEWINIIIEHPILLERPIVMTNEKAVLGRPPENVTELF